MLIDDWRKGKANKQRTNGHITGRNHVHSNTLRRPLDCQTSSHVSDSSFGCIIRSLGLRNVDPVSGHASD